MKGWYVIWTADTEEYSTKREALKRAKEIYKQGLDKEVFIQRFNDDNPNGYLADEPTIFIEDLM